MEPRNRRWSRVPTRSEHAEGHTVDAVLARRRRTRRGRRPLACVETLCAEPGRPCIWPGDPSPGPHGEPTGCDRGARVQGVGPLHSVCLAAHVSGGFKSRSARGHGLISKGGGNASLAEGGGRYGDAYTGTQAKAGHSQGRPEATSTVLDTSEGRASTARWSLKGLRRTTGS